ncbi:hypothetical protein EV183_004558 [Coemansia sp. RSA 2336]|nr:hypothetical protein EV183_004558 [Coemansia sp. RSA 2336]
MANSNNNNESNAENSGSNNGLDILISLLTQQATTLNTLLVEQRQDREEQRRDREEQRQYREAQRQEQAATQNAIEKLIEEQRRDREEQRRDREEQRREREAQRQDREERRQEQAEMKNAIQELANAQERRLVQGERLPTHDATPFHASGRLKSRDRAGYKQFGQSLSEHICRTELTQVLQLLGGDWEAAWAQATGGVFANNVIQDIVRRCSAEAASLGARHRPESEPSRQTTLNVLMKQIGVVLEAAGESADIYWTDTHNSPMDDRSKPDGLLLLKDLGTPKGWKGVCVAFEIKSDFVGNMADGLRGQLLSYMVGMAKVQPRRHFIGVSLAKNGDAYVYVCFPSKIHCAYVGTLPGYGLVPGSEVLAVKFLLFLQKQIAADIGFLCAKKAGILEPFCLNEMVSVDEISENPVISIQGDSPFSGRHAELVGAQTWLYRDHSGNIVKFHWCQPGSSEIGTHQEILGMGIPHVPQLLASAKIQPASSGLQGELLLIENAGTSIADVFKQKTLPAHMICDMFAGYVHTILAASSGHDGKDFVLTIKTGLFRQSHELELRRLWEYVP